MAVEAHPQFQTHSDCTACPLHDGCKSVGIPTRLHSSCSSFNPVELTTALLVLGEAPGADEDRVGRNFIGRSGKYLSRIYIKETGLDQRADIYYSNAVRCRPLQNVTPPPNIITTCHQHLSDDLHLLNSQYSCVVILCVGAVAAKSLFGSPLKAALSAQGQHYTPNSEEPAVSYPVYATYHPAYLSRGRNPNAIRAVESHLRLLLRHLDSDQPVAALGEDDYATALVPPAGSPLYECVTVDIETYGALRGFEQTVFDPRRSIAQDGIPRNRLVVTVACTFANNTSSIYVWSNREHRRALYKVFSLASRLLNQNIIFDLLYLRHADYTFKELLDKRYATGSLQLWDLAVTNYLDNEIRPERSLKNLAPLFGFPKYDESELNYDFLGPNDPLLHHYNIRDTARTYALHNYLSSCIRDRHPDTPKLSPYCYQWYSELLWTVLHMTEAGHTFDLARLETLRRTIRRRVGRCERLAIFRYDAPLSGKGSLIYVRQRVRDCAKTLPRGRAVSLETTDKGMIRTGDYNLQFLHLYAPRLEDRKFFSLVRKFRKASKILTSYINRLSTGDSRLLNDIYYPRWYFVPSAWEDNKEGGTNQSRLASWLQTMPSSIKKCGRPSITNGVYLWVDLSQIELRIAALLSNDPKMTADYLAGRDRHATTAASIHGELYNPDSHLQRQLGKHTNFLTIFRGGAERLRWMLWVKGGIRYPLSDCCTALNTFWIDHETYSDWLDNLVYDCSRRGCQVLPLIGQSKGFTGNFRTVSAQAQAIANFPVQTTASNVMLSAVCVLNRHFHTRRLRSRITAIIHDAVGIDCCAPELPLIRRLIAQTLPNPPYYQDLCALLGRTIPLTYDLTEHT